MSNKTNSKTTDAADNDATENTTPATMAQHLRKYRAKYVKTHGYNKQGSLDNGDNVAKLLRSLEPARVVALAEVVLGKKTGELAERYANLNLGQKRMNSGNLIRNAVKRGDTTAAKIKAAIKKVA